LIELNKQQTDRLKSNRHWYGQWLRRKGKEKKNNLAKM